MPGSALTRPQAAPPRGLPSSRSPASDFSRPGPHLLRRWAKRGSGPGAPASAAPALTQLEGFWAAAGSAPLTWGTEELVLWGEPGFAPNTAPYPAAMQDPHAKEFIV